jgi:tRNA(Ile)-lysidine synthase
VETVLLNLIRGTGLRGLTGMKPKTHTSFTEGKELCVIRPLLFISRAEIEDFLTENGQKFVTDSTNLEADVLRNRIRLQVLPLLRALNPAVSENIQRTAENLREAQALLDSIIKDFCNRNTIELRDLTKYGSIEFIAFEWLKNYGFNGSQVRQIIDAETGKIVTSPTGYDVLKDRDRLLVERSPEPLTPLCIPEEGTYCWCNSVNSNAVNHEKNERRDRFVVRKQSVFVSKTPDIATVDAAKVLFPLTVRRVEEGDWMIPFGMKGRKLLSDLMTDRKMTAFDKRRQLVVVDACGNTVWLVGLRVDSRAAVDTSTQEVLVMHT